MKFEFKKYHFFSVWAVLSAFVLVFAFTSAINVDEVLHYNHAKKVVNWYLTGGEDAACLHTPTSHLKYYGQSMDNVAAFINRAFPIEDEYLTHHLLGFLTGSLLLLIIGLITLEISNKNGLAILAMLLFFLSPRPMGQLVNNLKDIPFALGYAWSILIMIRITKTFPVFKWKHALQLGLAIAFTNSIRIGGLVLFPYFGLFTLILMISKPETFKSVSYWKDWLLKSFALVIIGYFLALILWPYGLLNPIKHPLETLQVMEHYKISIRQIFENKLIWSTDLPWYYLPRWLLISIPEFVWIGFGLGAVNYLYFKFLARNRETRERYTIRHFILYFSFLFPAIYVIVIDANLYSGWRQMYFIYPSMVVLAALGLRSTYEMLPRPVNITFIIILLGLSIQPSSFIFKNLNPDYVYFNGVTQGNKGAFGKYEYDYYWHHMKPAMLALDVSFPHNEKPLLIATNFDLSCYAKMDERFEFKYIHFMERNKINFDYAVLQNNYIHPWSLRYNTWKPGGVIHTIYHRGNPLVVVVKKQSDDAYLGHQAYAEGNYKLASDHFYKAYQQDRNDLNLCTYLAKSYLKEGNLKLYRKHCGSGKYKNRYYEPLRYVEAEYNHRQKRYGKAAEILEFILENNPRYTNAVGLLADCYEKLDEQEKLRYLKKKYKIN